MNNNSVVTHIETKDEIGKTLFNYVSHHVSCRPYSEYRHNINLKLIFTTVKSSVVTIRGNTISLPQNGRWYLYYVDNTSLMDVRLPNENTWTCLADRVIAKEMVYGFCSEHKIDIRVVIGSTSLCIPRRAVFVAKNPSENNFIFAVNQEVMRKLSPGNKELATDLWLNIYYHHYESDFRVIHYPTTISSEIEKFVNEANQIDSIAFLNGEIVTSPITINDVNVNDYAEIIEDDSLTGMIDITIKDQGDYINKDGNTRILVHIPKKYNPDNDIINHRVCDFVVIPDGSATGRYINRANTDYAFFTLTHNDFSIDKTLLNDYRNLFSSDIKLRVYIRNHKKIGLVLGRDSRYISCLYRLDDDTICNNLLGKTDMTLWSAKELEKYSPYSDIVDKYLSLSKLDNFKTWLNCLGYPTALDVSCKRVFHILATPDLLHKFYITLPHYFVGKNVTAHVFLNGLLIDPDYISCKSDLQYLKIKIDPSLRLSNKFTNNKPVSLENYLKAQYYGKLPYFTVELFEDPVYRGDSFELETGESKTVYVDQEYEIYRSVEFNNRNKLPDHYIFKRFQFNTAYRQLTAGETMNMVKCEDVEETNLQKITITNTINKCTFVIVSKHAYSKIYGVELQLKEMNYDIFCSHRLMVPAKKWFEYDEENESFVDSDKRSLIPYLNQDNELLVYLNHRELTRGLDYQLYQAKTETGCICGQFVISQNVDYLNVAGNTFEIYSVSERNALNSYGFLTDGRSTFEHYYSLFPNSGIMFNDGFAYDYPPDTVIGPYESDLHNKIRKGASTKIRAMMPREFGKLLDDYDISKDITNLKTVVKYMESVEYDLEAPAILERSHHIYSTFLQTVIEAVLRDRLRYNLRWNDSEIIDALSPYESMMKYDIGLSEENVEVLDPETFIQPPVSGLDYRFVDVLPTYRIEPQFPDLVITEKYPLLVIKNSNIPSVNGNFICVNPEPIERRIGDINEETTKLWKNEYGSYILHRQLDTGRYWVLYDEFGVAQYQAEDCVGVDKIWTLNWIPSQDGTPITIRPITIEINTVGEFLARRLSFTLRAQDRTFLTRVAKLYLNKDLVLDGVNIS